MATPEVESKFEKCEAKPVDNGNLAAESIVGNDQPRAATTDTASEHLCAVEIVEKGTADTTLNPETGLPVVTGDALKQSALALYDAMHPGIFGSPDFDKVRTILDTYSPDDRKRLEAAYDGLIDVEPLRGELKTTFSLFPDKYREAESILDRTGETNIIGNMTVAIETANGFSLIQQRQASSSLP